ncbi:hypothetical protein N9383_02115 [Granulosicoccus sp.]|nr:hypothetical protein [Granulosicoccus sp.]
MQFKTHMQARLQKDTVAVLTAKEALGEAGLVWWNDGAISLPITSALESSCIPSSLCAI